MELVWGCLVLGGGVRDGLIGKVTFEQRPKRGEVMSCGASSGADSTLLGKGSTWGRGREDVPMNSEGDWGSGQVMTKVRNTTDHFHVQHFSSQE